MAGARCRTMLEPSAQLKQMSLLLQWPAKGGGAGAEGGEGGGRVGGCTARQSPWNVLSAPEELSKTKLQLLLPLHSPGKRPCGPMSKIWISAVLFEPPGCMLARSVVLS